MRRGRRIDRIDPLEVTRVVGVDINRAYLEIASTRYSERFNTLELHCSDIAQAHLGNEPVNLVYAALVFEYVNVPLALQHLFPACRDVRPFGHAPAAAICGSGNGNADSIYQPPRG